MGKKMTEKRKMEIKKMLEEEGIKKAGIFGSYARGEQKKNSDIDILIEVEENLSLTDLVRIKMRLEKKLGKEIDLVEYNSIHPLIKKQVLMEEVRII